MTRFVVAKWTSLAALLSAAVLLSGCETSSGKPTVCTVKGKQVPCKVAKKTQVDTSSATRGARNRNY
ncbi:Lipoprotein (plasmid) [Shinella sp. WSC3-e]|nr:exported hypothetical protein [Rhizobiaceae bacterium]CAK7259538.1 Lipoprotein [Shinella sp. WSC3-e]